MKNRYFLSAFVAVVLALPGLFSCNSEVFIDDFAPSDESVLVPSDGHARVIDFKSDSWNIFDVYTLDGDAIKGDVYDADGQRLGSDPMYVEPGWTKFVLDHPAVALTVERTKGDKLRVTSTENASGQPFEWANPSSALSTWATTTTAATSAWRWSLRRHTSWTALSIG